MKEGAVDPLNGWHFNPFQTSFSADRIPAEKQKEYNLRYMLVKVRTA